MTVAKRRAASRVLAIAALRDILTAFDAKDLLSPEGLEASVSSDLQTLKGLLNDDAVFHAGGAVLSQSRSTPSMLPKPSTVLTKKGLKSQWKCRKAHSVT